MKKNSTWWLARLMAGLVLVQSCFLGVAQTESAPSSAPLPACERRLPEESAKNHRWEDRAVLNGRAAAPAADRALWYRQPACEWTEALPLGNGRLGAMIFGGVADERVQLNVDSLWDGEPLDPNDPNALANLPKIRQLLFDGKNQQAADLAGEAVLITGRATGLALAIQQSSRARRPCRNATVRNNSFPAREGSVAKFGQPVS